MPAYDTTFKELAKTGLAELVRFLLPEMTFADLVELPPEFPSTLRATDLLLKTIGHRHGPRLCLFESQVQREVALPRLLLLRAALAHFHYDLPVTAVLLALTREAVVPGAHRYWYRSRAPWAPLTQTSQPLALTHTSWRSRVVLLGTAANFLPS